MKKSKKVAPKSASFTLHKKQFITVTLVSSLLAVLIVLGAASYITLRELAVVRNHVGNSDLRAFIIDAATNLTIEAPVDHATGDVYFPQAKLKVASANLDSIRYNYYPADTANSIQEEIIITSRNLLSQAKADLYPVEAEEFLDKIPRFQDCSRAIRVVFQPISDSAASEDQLTLAHTTVLADGRSAYTYYNAGCTITELDQLVEKLKTLQSY